MNVQATVFSVLFCKFKSLCIVKEVYKYLRNIYSVWWSPLVIIGLMQHNSWRADNICEKCNFNK